MKFLQIIIFMIFMGAMPIKIFTQNLNFSIQKITENDGLNVNYITCIHQDKNGFLWMGSLFGINRYDGKRISQILPNHSKEWSLHANLIHHINEDSTGLLWISTDNGLSVLDPKTERAINMIEYIPEFPNEAIKKTVIDKDGKVWFYALIQNQIQIYSLSIDNQALKNTIQRSENRIPTYELKAVLIDNQIFKKIHLFMHYDDSSILLCNNEGYFYSFKFTDQKLVPVSFASISEPITKTNKFIIWSKKLNKGVALGKNHDFNNDFYLNQISEVLPYGKDELAEFVFFNNEIKLIKKINGNQYQYINNAIIKLDKPTNFTRLVDKSGNIWVGSVGYGIYKINKELPVFTKKGQGINFYNIEQLPDNLLWPGYLNQINLFNIATGDVIEKSLWKSALPEGSEIKNVIRHSDQSKIYLLGKTIKNEFFLAKYDIKEKSTKIITKDFWFFSHAPLGVLEAKDGSIWISGVKGELINYNPKNQNFIKWDLKKYYPEKIANKLNTRDIIQTKNGDIWLANNFGLARVVLKNDQLNVITFHNYKGTEKKFHNDGVISLKQDPVNPKLLWLGTMGGGLANFNLSNNKLNYFFYPGDEKLIFAGNLTFDKSGLLWMATEKGIKCFSNQTMRFVNFYGENKLKFEDLNLSAKSWVNDDKIYFPSGNGLICIEPSKLLKDNQSAEIWITNIQINGEDVYDVIKSGYNENNKKFPTSLDLQNNQNNITFHLSSPNAIHPENVNFLYRITGVSDEWKVTDGRKKIELNGLGHGNYTIEVRTADYYDSDENSQTIKIQLHIRPPWYASNLALLIFAILIASVIYGIFKYDRKRLVLEHEALLIKEEAEKNKAIHTFTNRFFGFLAHEFKTPLSILLGINDELKHEVTSPKSIELLESVQKESSHMLEIIDEMIDMTKLNKGVFKLNYTSDDIVGFIKNLIHSFKSMAMIHQINIKTSFPDEEIIMDFDPVRFKYIMNNLLSNALRFTPKNGIIQVEIEKQDESKLKIKISDNGTGISDDAIDHIFEPYYTTHTNNSASNERHYGLGLAFVKEIIAKMEGEVLIENRPDHGTIFKILLPLKSDYTLSNFTKGKVKSDNIFSSIEPAHENEKQEKQKSLPLALLVEDNLNSMGRMVNLLQNDFKLMLARNGEEALQVMHENQPDIVVTDLLMPLMDGNELTKQIKLNPLTNHIPVIMLSGKSDLGDRLKSQTAGADIYLSKPYHHEELINLMKNICALQLHLKNKLKIEEDFKSAENENSSINNNPVESEDKIQNNLFLKQLLEIFEAQYMNETFDTDELCKILHISRAQLYRKLASISDQGAMELLRNFRLDKAYRLMSENQEWSTKEIAFKVGFKERSHFSNLFSKKFNISPREMKKKSGD